MFKRHTRHTLDKFIYDKVFNIVDKTMKKWTRKEIEFLKKNYKKYLNSEIAKKLNTTQSSIEHKLRRLKIKKGKMVSHTNKPWTEKELNFLKTNSEKYSIEELSKLLSRTYGSIKHKVKEFNLYPKKEWRKWNKQEISFLKNNYLKLSYTEIGNKLNKSRRAVRHKAKDFNLNKLTKISKSQILKEYFKRHTIHLKGRKIPEKTKRKLSIAMKNYYAREDPEILKKLTRKRIRTRMRRGSQSGKNHPWYGKKRPEFAEWSKKQWKNPEHRKKIIRALSKTSFKGSKPQKALYGYLVRYFGKNNINYNDWETLNHKYEIDISIPSKKIAIEWDNYYWHYQHKKRSETRDLSKNKLINEIGWKFIRIKDNRLNKADIKKIHETIIPLIKDIHSPKFKYTGGFYI